MNDKTFLDSLERVERAALINFLKQKGSSTHLDYRTKRRFVFQDTYINFINTIKFNEVYSDSESNEVSEFVDDVFTKLLDRIPPVVFLNNKGKVWMNLYYPSNGMLSSQSSNNEPPQQRSNEEEVNHG